jgi:heat shock protein beta
MKEGQTDIYYLAGESLGALQNSPFVERLLKKGYEILYMTDAIDEWCVSNIPRYENKYNLINASKEGLKLDEDKQQSDEKKEKDKAIKDEFSSLLTFLKDTIGADKILKASISTNLVRAPSAITAGMGGYTANMERLMKAQAFADQKQFMYMRSQRILEINPKHPIIQKLNSLVKEDATNPLCKDLAILMYDTASLHSGFSVDDSAGFASRIHNLMKLTLQLDLNAQVEEEEEEEEVSVNADTSESYEEKLEDLDSFATSGDEEVTM